MRAHTKTRRTVTTVDVTVPTTTETVVATVAGVSPQSADARVVLDGLCQIATGVGANNLTLRVRRGIDATGVLVGEANPIGASAGTNSREVISAQDVPGEGTFTYVLTVQQGAATGNGTAMQSVLTASV